MGRERSAKYVEPVETSGRIIEEETITIDGVQVLPKFDPTKATYKPKPENPLYRTSANVIGAKMPGVFDVPTSYRCATGSEGSPCFRGS